MLISLNMAVINVQANIECKTLYCNSPSPPPPHHTPNNRGRVFVLHGCLITLIFSRKKNSMRCSECFPLLSR